MYVEDKDDWDLPDKSFSWKTGLPGFEISEYGGEVRETLTLFASLL